MRKSGVLLPIFVSIILLLTHQLYPHFHSNSLTQDQPGQQQIDDQQPRNFLLTNLGPDHLQHFKPYHGPSVTKVTDENVGMPEFQINIEPSHFPASTISLEVVPQSIPGFISIVQLRGPPAIV